MVGNAVKQFYTAMHNMGRIDYLLIDMPPGTGDVALTVMQSIPIKWSSYGICTSRYDIYDSCKGC